MKIQLDCKCRAVKNIKILSPIFLLYFLQLWGTISRQEDSSIQRQKTQILHSVTPEQG